MSFVFTKGYDDYAKFPMHYLRVTQSWNEGNHKPHWNGANYKDYPIDLGGMDSGRDYLYAPVDMKIVALNGIGNKLVSNKIFLESVNKVSTVKHGKTKIFMTAVHFNDSDVKKFGLKVGKTIKAGQPICFEGTETASANHLHFTCGVGSANTSIQNNNGKWVTKGDCKKPEEIFFVDPKFTKILDRDGLEFKYLPKIEVIKRIGKTQSRDIDKDQIEVIVDNLIVRNGASIENDVLGYANKGIYDYFDIKQNNNYTWYNIGMGWITFNDKWCKLYKRVIKIEEKQPEVNLEKIDDEKTLPLKKEIDNSNETMAIKSNSNNFTKIISFFKKVFNFIKNLFFNKKS